MKAVLEFNLDEFDDKLAHNRCVKSLDMALMLFDLNKLIFEYKQKEITLKQFESRVKELYDIYYINLDELIN